MANDSAKFVVTGEFNSASMMNQIEGAFKQIPETFKKHLEPMQKEIKDVLAGGVSGAATAEMNKNMKKVKDNVPDKKLKNMKTDLGEIKADLFIAAQRVLLWGAASRLVFGVFQQIGDSIQNIIKLNTILTNIAKIRPLGLPTEAIGQGIINSAKQYGVAFEEIGETQRTFFQQGFSAAEVAKLTQAQLLGVTAAGLSAQESIELLIGSMSIFNIEADKSISLIDKLQNVQANYAVSTQDLATAIRRVGPVVEQLGGDIDHLIGVITALKESTRKSGEFIGTALSTIFSRMVTPVGAKALSSIGVAINKTAIELRPLRDILNETAMKWKDLSEQEKISTAFALGARRRYAQVIALMNNYSTVLEASASSQTAFGAAVQAQAIEVGSVSRQFSIARETAKEAGMAILQAFAGSDTADSALIKLANTLRDFAINMRKAKEGVASFLKVSATFAGKFIIASVLFFATKRVALFLASVKSMTYALLGVKPAADAAATGLAAMSRQAAILNVVSAGIGILGTIVAITSLTAAFRKNKEEAKELSKVYKDFDKYSNKQKETLKEYYAVAKQFKDVKGPEVMRDLFGQDLSGTSSTSILGYLRNVKGAADDFNNVSMDDIKEAISAVSGDSVTLKESLQGASNVLGLFATTRMGIANEFAEFRSNVEAVGEALGLVLTDLNRLETKGNLFTGEKLFKEFAGKDIQSFIEDLQSELKTIEVPVNLDTGVGLEGYEEDFKKVGITLDAQMLKARAALVKAMEDSGNTTLKLLADSGDLGKDKLNEIAQALLDNLITSQSLFTEKLSVNEADYSKLVPALYLDLQIDEAAQTKNMQGLIDDILGIVDDFASENTLQAEFDRIMGEGKLDIYKNLIAAPGTSKSIDKFQELTVFLSKKMPAAFEKYISGMIPQEKILQLYIQRTQEAIGGTLYWPNALAKAEKGIIEFNYATSELSGGLSKAALDSQLLGKNLLTLQKTVVKARISKGIKAIVDAQEISNEIVALEKLQKEYQNMRDKLLPKDAIEIAEKYGLKASSVADLVAKLGTKLENLKAAQQGATIEASLAGDELKQLQIVLEAIETKLLLTDKVYKDNIASLKAYESAVKKAVSANLKTAESQAKIIKSAELLGKASDYATQLNQEIQHITASYDRQEEALVAQQRIIASVYGISLDELKTRIALLNSSVEQMKVLDDILEVEGTLLQTGETINAQNEKQGYTLERQAVTKLLNLEYDKEALSVAKENELRTAAMNKVLEQTKKIQSDINSLASGYAKATTDLVKNVQSLITERGFSRQVLEPFAQAYTESVTSRLADSLTSIFESVAGKTIGAEIDEAKALIQQLQSKRTVNEAADIMLLKMVQGGEISGDIIKLKMMQATAGGGLGMTPSSAEAEQQRILQAQLDEIRASLGLIVNNTMSSLDTELITAQESLDQTKKLSLMVSGIQAVGFVLGNITGGGTASGNLGAGIGGSLGSILGSSGGPLGSAIGGALGSALGGLVGGLFSKEEEVEDPKKTPPSIYEANTDALRANTEALIQASQDFGFMSKLLNAPSNFALPSPAVLGGGLPVNIEVNINAPVGSTSDIADAVYDSVSLAYSQDYRRIGRRG